MAIKGKDWRSAETDVLAAASRTEAFQIPTSAWRVQATAAELYRRWGRDAAAEEHRRRAVAIVGELVASLDGDPLGGSLLEGRGGPRYLAESQRLSAGMPIRRKRS